MTKNTVFYILFSLILVSCQQSTGIQGNSNDKNKVSIGNVSGYSTGIKGNENDNNQVIVGDNNQLTINKNGEQKDIREFKKFVPTTYLNNLPRIKYKSYIEAHKLWDTGITSQMHYGNKLLADKLRQILIDTAESAYTSEFFEGKTVSQYYDNLVSRLMKASYDAQPDIGTSYGVIASGERAQIIDDLIIRLVKDISEPSYFSQWKPKWDKATELGSEGIKTEL